MNPFEESILGSVKGTLGIPVEYEYFDQQILFNINTVLATLPQLGVGPKNGFIVEDDTQTWFDLIGDTPLKNRLLHVRSYVALRVRLLFDPPTSSGAIDAIERQLKEIEWRITVAEDPSEREEENNE